jgi:hypothetical protein
MVHLEGALPGEIFDSNLEHKILGKRALYSCKAMLAVDALGYSKGEGTSALSLKVVLVIAFPCIF